MECARTVTLVARELCKDIPDLQLVDSEPHNTVEGCFMSMTFGSEADIPLSKITEWEGTVLWRSSSNPYRPGYRRRNWFVGVHFINPPSLPEIKECDIVYETCRSRGKGGQNVNKVETAVRATHTPTGVSVKCSEERCQSQNKSRARERLLLKLMEKRTEVSNQAQTDKWSCHTGLQRGNPVKEFSARL